MYVVLIKKILLYEYCFSNSGFGGCLFAVYCSFINIKWVLVFVNFFGVKDVYWSLIRNIMVVYVRIIVYKFIYYWSCEFILLDYWNGFYVNVNKIVVFLNLYFYKDIYVFKKESIIGFFFRFSKNYMEYIFKKLDKIMYKN